MTPTSPTVHWADLPVQVHPTHSPPVPSRGALSPAAPRNRWARRSARRTAARRLTRRRALLEDIALGKAWIQAQTELVNQLCVVAGNNESENTEDDAHRQRVDVHVRAGEDVSRQRVARSSDLSDVLARFKTRRLPLGAREHLSSRRAPEVKSLGGQIPGVTNSEGVSDPVGESPIAAPPSAPQGVGQFINSLIADGYDFTSPVANFSGDGENMYSWREAHEGMRSFGEANAVAPAQPASPTSVPAVRSALLDSGATSTFGRLVDGLIPTGIPSGKEVGMPDGRAARASERALLPMSQLRDGARAGDILPALSDNTLVSVGTLANNDYATIFWDNYRGVDVYDTRDVNITIDGEPVLSGWRDGSGLWRIPMTDGVAPKPSTDLPLDDFGRYSLRLDKHQVSNLYDLPSLPQRIAFIHACLGFPTKATMIDAAREGRLVGIPFASVENIHRHFPESDETAKGHMEQQRQGVRSTKEQSHERTKERDVHVQVWDLRRTSYSDQTGRFPFRSYRRYRYLMVMVEIDSSCILVEPLKTKDSSEMTEAYLRLHARLKSAGLAPRKHVMDNEISEELRDCITETCALELVPPGCHRRNVAEVAIKTFKKHFISILAGLPDSFPMRLWCELLPQAELTCNILRPSHARPGISAHAYMHGPFNFDRTPLAPLGCEVQCHEKAANRGSWAEHSVDGWYIGTSHLHYRAFTVFIKQSRAKRVTDTVLFKHKYITWPAITHGDVVTKAALELVKALKGKPIMKTQEQMRDLTALSEVFSQLAATNQEAAALPTHQVQPAPPPPTRTSAPWRAPSGHTSHTPGQHTPPVERTDDVPDATDSSSNDTTPSAPVLVPAPDASPPPPMPPLNGSLRQDDAPPHTEDDDRPPAARTRSKTRLAATMGAICHALCASSASASTSITPRQAAGRKYPLQVLQRLNHAALDRDTGELAIFREVANAVLDKKTGQLLEYRQLLKHPDYRKPWLVSSANEFGRLAQGVGGRVNGTNTIFFINKHEVPNDRFRDTTYAKFVCNERPQKKEVNRTRMTAGGNRINYPGEVGTPTAEMALVKVLWNSVISTKNARYMTMDLKDFYLNTPLRRFEYIKLKMSDVPPEIVDEYNLHEKETEDGHVYLEVRRGMYGLPQAGLIAQEELEGRLNKHGYRQSKLVPGLWLHDWRPISFSLVVDDFGVKYVGREHAEHLQSVLKEHYEVATDWKGTKYIGLTLDWDYDQREVHVSLPGYVERAATELGHKPPARRQPSPWQCAPIKWGEKQQFVEEPVPSPPLDKKGQKYIQRVNGKLLYLARAVDSTMLVALSNLASEQAAPTEETMRRARWLLDYATSNETAVVTFRASDMVLAAHSDASYLSAPRARSRAGGHFFLSENDPLPRNNGAILTIAQIIKRVMTSAAEAELGALFLNTREAIYLRRILEELGHPQPRTPIQTDNSTADGLINGKILPRRLKSMDKDLYWLRDQEAQAHTRVFWQPGPSNNADYQTKLHTGKHHEVTRPVFLTPWSKVVALRARLATSQKIVGDSVLPQ